MALGFKDRLLGLINHRRIDIDCRDSDLIAVYNHIKTLSSKTQMIKYILDEKPDYILWAFDDMKVVDMFLIKEDKDDFDKEIIKQNKKNSKKYKKILSKAKLYKKYQGD